MTDKIELGNLAGLSPDDIAAQIADLSEEEVDQLMSIIESSTVAAIEGEPVSSLADILKILEDDELRLACEMHGFRFEVFDVEAATREELEEKAAFFISHPALQELTMLDMGPSIREDYLEIMHQGAFTFALEGADEGNPYARLRGLLDALASMMLVFPFAHQDTLTYLVPDEVQKSCEGVVAEGFLEYAAENDLAYQYVDAAINLYGAIRIADLARIVEGHIPEGFKHGQASDMILDLIEGEGVWAYFEDEGIVAHEIFHDGAGLGYGFVKELLAHAGTNPRYVPGKEEFLAYADPRHFEENFEAELLTELLAGFFATPFEVMEETVAYVQECARQGVRNDVLIETLFEEFLPGPFANEAQAKLAIKQVAKLVRSTRTWACNGHTPEEIDKIAGR